MGCGASNAAATKGDAYNTQMKPGDDEVDIQLVNEHYQPYEFPIRPILTVRTQELVKDSWNNIVNNMYDSDKTQSGKISGASYFYNIFFEQLFIRFKEFERIFPSIKSRADIISKVMALCISIRVEELDMVKLRLRSLGAKHISIVHDPWLFGIYATTILNTIRICLAEKATDEIMSSWLHLLSFVLRNMLPEYFRRSAPFLKLHEGVVCGATSMNAQTQLEIKEIAKKERSVARTALSKKSKMDKEKSVLASAVSAVTTQKATEDERESEASKN